MSVDGFQVKSTQVAASYTEREDPRKTFTILVAYGTEEQQTTRLNLKMNLAKVKKKSIFIMPNKRSIFFDCCHL